MVFSLTLQQHRLHAAVTVGLQDLVIVEALRHDIQRGHSCEEEWEVTVDGSRDVSIPELLVSRMRAGGSGLLLVSARTAHSAASTHSATDGGRDLHHQTIASAHKFSNLLQYQSVIEVSIKNIGSRRRGGRRCRLYNVKASSVSCSILPPWLPLGFLLAPMLIWLPFSDYGANAAYIRAFRQSVMQSMCDTTPGVYISSAKRAAVGNNEADTATAMTTTYVQPSLVFFASFILLPVLSAAFFLLFLA